MNCNEILSTFTYIDSTFEPPPEWTAMTDNLAIIQVPQGNAEYSNVIDRFHGQVGKRNIVKVWVKQFELWVLDSSAFFYDSSKISINSKQIRGNKSYIASCAFSWWRKRLPIHKF